MTWAQGRDSGIQRGMSQLTFDGTFNLKIVNATFSDSKMSPFIKRNHWLVSSFREGKNLGRRIWKTQPLYSLLWVKGLLCPRS